MKIFIFVEKAEDGSIKVEDHTNKFEAVEGDEIHG